MTAEDGGIPGTGLMYPTSPEAVAAALKSDPILVDPMFGNGATEAVRDGFADLAAQTDHAVYVVLVPMEGGDAEGSDPERDLALYLSGTGGLGPGYYVIDTDAGHSAGDVEAIGVPDDVSPSAVTDGMAPDTYASGTYDGSVLPSDTGRLAMDLDIMLRQGEGFGQDDYDHYAQSSPWASPPNWESSYDHQAPDPGAYWAFGTTALVVGAGAAWILLRHVATWGPAPQQVGGRSSARRKKAWPELRTDPAAVSATLTPRELRARVESELPEVAEARAARDRASLDAARWTRIDTAVEAARLVLARAGERERDVPDLVGALVLARTAAFALEDGRGRQAPYRPCFFDPRHGRGVKRRDVPVGDVSLDVACCSLCARRRPAELQPLRDRRRPYYERDTVWARTGYGAFVDDLPFQVLDELRETR